MMRVVWVAIVALFRALPITPLETDFSLPIQDVNLLILTDVHSWVAGHRHQPEFNANYGHVLSFYEELRSYCARRGKDLFFVMNGDFLDGTGLTTFPPEHLTPILEKMPWDAVNIGNHELYKDSTVEFITRENGFVDHWDGGYLTSNTLLAETSDPIGERYKFMIGKEDGEGRDPISVLTFGFLYNFNHNCESTLVEEVEGVVESDWFQSALRKEKGDFDAIVVLAHMDAADPLVGVILRKIRQLCGGEMPVQFVTGHSHVRKHEELDAYSESFEAGHYLDTLGFASFSLDASDANFQHEYIDANVEQMGQLMIPASENFMTPRGQEIRDLIVEKQNELGLFEILGCSPQTYMLSDGTLRRLYVDVVIRQQLFEQLFEESEGVQSNNKLFLQTPGGFRYDLYEGDVTLDDLISMSPFDDELYKIGENVKGKALIEAFGESLNMTKLGEFASSPKLSEPPEFMVSGDVDKDAFYEVYSVDFDSKNVASKLQSHTGDRFVPEPVGITTNELWRGFMKKQWPCETATTREAFPGLSEKYAAMKSCASSFRSLWWSVFDGSFGFAMFERCASLVL